MNLVIVLAIAFCLIVGIAFMLSKKMIGPTVDDQENSYQIWYELKKR